jgi:predicted nucleic acid-binding protein
MVTLVDTSAWVEFLRGTESPSHLRLRGLIDRDEPIAITDVIAMEVLAGARKPGEASALQRLLGRARPLPTRPFFDHEAAARIFRACRAEGETLRGIADCMIAAVAIRTDVPVLHADRDFEAIARHTELRLA